MGRARLGFVTNSSSSSFIFKATDEIDCKDSIYKLIRGIVLECTCCKTPIEQLVEICETIDEYNDAIYESINYTKFRIIDHRNDRVDNSYVCGALDCLSDTNSNESDWFGMTCEIICTKGIRESILEFGEFGIYFESGTFNQWVFDRLYKLSSEYTFR